MVENSSPAAEPPSPGRRAVRERARAAGLLVVPSPAVPPSPDALRAATVGTGTAVSEALEADRGGDR